MMLGGGGDVADMLTLCDRVVIDPGKQRRCLLPPTEREVVLTAFEGSERNPSTDVLHELSTNGMEGIDFKLHTLPFSYEAVDERIPIITEENPYLIVHLVPHSKKNTISFEQQAFLNGYLQTDNLGFIPVENRVKCDGSDTVLRSLIVNEDLVKKVTENCGLDGTKYGGLKVETSDDPGRSIGGYTYYLSLKKCRWNVLFLHIPEFEGDCTKEAVTEVVRETLTLSENTLMDNF